MVYDSDYREAANANLETAFGLTEQGADSPGMFVVPTNVSKITEIRIGANGLCADDTAFGFTCAVHLTGGGIKLGEGWFPGPVGIIEGHATGSGTIVGEQQRYLTNIPVKPGGQFNAEGYMLGEDIGAIHIFCEVVYDGPVVGRIIDMDYRSIDLAAVNTLTTMTERGAAVVEGDMRPPYPVIGELFLGAGAKITASAGTSAGFGYKLSGPGLRDAGNYNFLGRTLGSRTDLNESQILPLTQYACGINTKVNNPIRVQGQMLETDLGTAFGIAAFGYY